MGSLEAGATAVRLYLAALLGLDRNRGRACARNERALLEHHARLLSRVAAAAEQAHRDWEAGEDLAAAMVPLRAELRTAAEFSP